MLAAQADALGIGLELTSASWADYTGRFSGLLGRVAGRIEACVFGDIETDARRRWCEQVAASAGVVAIHPLWQRPRRALLEELWAHGFRTTVVVVRDGVLDRELLGCELNPQVVAEIERQGADGCGENGEYHTVVTDGPVLARRCAGSMMSVHCAQVAGR